MASVLIKRIIVVLGMHRSGTSVITRGLQVMGVELGKRLMPAHSEVNAKGFWEDMDFNALDNEMLHALESDWHYLASIGKSDVEKLRNIGFHNRAIELLRTKISDAQVYGVKDPRITKLLPFWKGVFAQSGLDVRFVLALRNPMSVAKSLAKRDKLDFDKSNLLWLDHMLGALVESKGATRVLVDYDLLMSEPDRELNRIATVLGLTLDVAELEKYKSEFLDATLRHGSYELKDLRQNKDVPPLEYEVFEVLQGAAKGELDIDAAEFDLKLANWCTRLDDMQPAIRLVDRFSRKEVEQTRLFCKQLIEKDEQLIEKDEQLIEKDEQLVEKDRQLVEEDRQLVEEDRQLAEKDRQLAEKDRQLAEKDRQLAEKDEQLAEEDRQLAVKDRQLAVKDRQLAVKDRQFAVNALEIAELNSEIVGRGEWAVRLDKQLKEAQIQIASILASTSWKVTRPMREAKRWLTQPGIQTRRYLGQGVKLIKRLYLSLPFDYQTRAKHRRYVAKYTPKLLNSAYVPDFVASPLVRPNCKPDYDPDDSIGEVQLVTSQEPVVSVIIPVYGKCGYTLRCLASIADNSPTTAFEVIIVDDCSPDNTVEILQRVRGIRTIVNAENQGFIRSCNIGAQASKGQYVYFLNNDTEVTQGWLDELVCTFELFPGTGLVGSKLVYPDGPLQEAGGIIWKDGSAWNFGRNQDPSLPVYNYAREVDYCSGASIVIPKDLFFELGGFDEHYLPAYCEDSDLALKIRSKGYRVIYQPLSTVVHYEGATSGTDITHGAKAYQVENSKKLYARWKDILQQHQPNGENVDAEKDRGAQRRVLVIDHCTPTPNQDAGSVTVFNLMLLLREMNFQVTFIPEDNYLYMPGYTTDLQRAGIEVLYAPFVTSVVQHVKVCGHRYDLVFLFRPGVIERHLDVIRRHCMRAKVLYHTIDLHFIRMQREAELHGDSARSKEVVQMKQREYAAIEAADASIVHSTTELELLQPDLPEKKIFVFPLILDVCSSTKRFTERRDIVFIGGYQHAPNVDAVLYFVDEIMPILRQQLPRVRFFAVGSKPTQEILRLASEDIEIVGFVENLPPFLDKIKVAIAPLRYGAGIKGKIGTTMSVGLPTVATSLAAEGMALTDGKNILVADGAEAFAAAIVRLYRDESLWQLISDESMRFADMAWGAEAAWKIQAQILGELGINVERGTRPLKLYSLENR